MQWGVGGGGGASEAPLCGVILHTARLKNDDWAKAADMQRTDLNSDPAGVGAREVAGTGYDTAGLGPPCGCMCNSCSRVGGVSCKPGGSAAP